MPPPKDLYELLGVARDAPQDEIRKAYLKLAHKYHPDKTGGDKAAETKLKEINGAYDILKNPDKRAQYDRFGSMDGQGPGGFGGFGPDSFGGSGFEAPFEDFFDMLFGQGGRRKAGPRSRPGNDLEFQISLTLEEVSTGTKKKVRFNRMELCSGCQGSGAAPGSRPETCTQCGGTGQVRAAHGFFSVTRTCGHCHGVGQVITKPCHECGGAGQVKTRREISVDVPRGIDAGARLRVSGEGEPGMGNAPRGDLYLLISIEPHPVFTRKGVDILCQLPVTFAQAALGDTVNAPTLHGVEPLKVPAGAQTGTEVHLRGQGLPDLRGFRQGDLVVTLIVETPSKLSRRQKELLKELGDISDKSNHPLHEAFRERLRKIQR